MSMLYTDDRLQHFKGWLITDVVVRRKDLYHLIMRKAIESNKADVLQEKRVTKRLYTIKVADFPQGNKQIKNNAILFRNWDTVYVGASFTDRQHNEVVMISVMGDVYARATQGYEADEDNIPDNPDGPKRSIIRKIKTIKGHLYIVGYKNSVGYRQGVNNWVSLCANLPLPKNALDNKHNGKDYELEDIDGFAHDDLYVVGGKGNLWHFDGTAWEKLSLPSNLLTNAICCAGDGFVYIGGQSGSIFRGRGHQWELLSREYYSAPFRDIVWHSDQLWCTSDYGLWTVKNNKLESVNLLPELRNCVGHLSVGDGVMIMSGLFAAALHDGKEWQLIFDSFSIQDLDDIYGDDEEDEDEDD